MIFTFERDGPQKILNLTEIAINYCPKVVVSLKGH